MCIIIKIIFIKNSIHNNNNNNNNNNNDNNNNNNNNKLITIKTMWIKWY